jgi:saccharopine dehydrogenase-like NADP-dependent oxidoreductase
MKRGFNILVLGNGRIARAVSFFLGKSSLVKSATLDPVGKNAAKYDLLVGAFPGDLGTIPLKLALKHKIDLIDISDVEPQVYIKNKRLIAKRGITVIPCCGFGPGLINFILGKELEGRKNIDTVQIKAGSLSPKPDYFPFLWCFEDLVLEHRIPSWQIINKKTYKFGPFARFQEEKFFGIAAESYFAQSGFENMMKGAGVNNFSFRVVRPRGFREFFHYLESEGFLTKANMPVTKSIVEKDVRDNITLAAISLIEKGKDVTWLMKSQSKRKEALNSMQKITAITPAAVALALLRREIGQRGLLFMESLGTDRFLFEYLIGENRKAGIVLERKETRS